MKVIFLDVDGVLNSDSYIEKQLNNPNKGIESEIDVATIKLLKKAIDATNARIVLASSWRRVRKCEALEKLFMQYGILLKEKTPYIHGERGLEIKQYLKEHENIDQYLILDDDVFESFDDELMENLILTKLDQDYHGIR